LRSREDGHPISPSRFLRSLRERLERRLLDRSCRYPSQDFLAHSSLPGVPRTLAHNGGRVQDQGFGAPHVSVLRAARCTRQGRVALGD
jgi:hypothetical protein